MRQIKLYLTKDQPISEPERRYRARKYDCFYLRSLFLKDPYVKMNPRDRFTEIYLQTSDENIYKLYFESEQLILMSGSDSSQYLFTEEEMKSFLSESDKGILKLWKQLPYGQEATDYIVAIECVSRVIDYPADDEWFKDAASVSLANLFERQRRINLTLS